MLPVEVFFRIKLALTVRLVGFLDGVRFFSLIMERTHPSVWAINSIVCSKLLQRFFLWLRGLLLWITGQFTIKSAVVVLYSSSQPPQHILPLMGRCDDISTGT